MNRSGPAIYFDGESTARRAVTVEIDPAAVLVRGAEGRLLARWPYGELEEVASHDGALRLGRSGSTKLERLEVRDPDLIRIIDALSHPVDRSGTRTRRSRRKVVLWSVAAMISLLLVGIYGVPLLASRLAPYVPLSVERRFGEVVDAQVRAMLDPGQQGRNFECGWAEGEKAGRAALERLVGRLAAAAALPVPLSVVVVRRKEANAIALPGGHVYVFEGLIDKARSADEVAGVIGHELGHVAHRDGTRSALQAAGLSFLFGLVLGDFVGGGAVVIAARTVLQLAYSREVEAAADLYAVDLMTKAGGDARALGAILERITGAIEPGAKILLNHPETRERVEAIGRAAGGKAGRPLLAPAEWAALQRICAGS
ncbi:MAG: M48 family metallopeptidase [Variibacter sp.]|nr:M48 family metallopeptidase [Variibacter sp.]